MYGGFLAMLQSPYGAFCLRRWSPPLGGLAGPGWLQSPYGAFCLRPTTVGRGRGAQPGGVAIPLRGFLFATSWNGQSGEAGTSSSLQSPYGAFCLRLVD